jgi:DNA-binding response OmpR family regulator
VELEVPTILLVEDDEDFSSELADYFHDEEGFSVIRAPNGRAALKVFDPDRVDVVLTDLFMPAVDGIELIMQLRRLSAGVKIIAMSGGGTATAGNVLRVAARLGATEVLAKPFSTQELSTAVERALRPGRTAKAP